MKKLLFIAICSLLSFVVNGQYHTLGKSYIEDGQYSVSNRATLLYLDKPNLVSLHPPKGIAVKRMSLLIKNVNRYRDNGAVLDKGSGSFEIRISGSGRYEITVLQDSTPLYTVDAGTERSRLCHATLSSGIPRGKEKTEAIKNESSITLHFINEEALPTDYPLAYVKILRIRNGIETEVENTGPYFNAEARKLLSETMPGDIYLFEGISFGKPEDYEHNFYARSIMIEAI